MESLGYRGLAVGFFEENVQVAFTSDCERCMTGRVVEYLGGITLAGEWLLPNVSVTLSIRCQASRHCDLDYCH